MSRYVSKLKTSFIALFVIDCKEFVNARNIALQKEQHTLRVLTVANFLYSVTVRYWINLTNLMLSVTSSVLCVLETTAAKNTKDGSPTMT